MFLTWCIVFPQNAKYAGPQDEYICTGSDSGRAWIYERATGTVASFLSSDQSTCNGVVPHPVLPFFLTYGIDSTAKLWRATTPVDRDADDSPLVRIFRKTLPPPPPINFRYLPHDSLV
jgi:WD40 repeat protein